MHHIHKTKSFTLSSYPFGESGRILKLLTKDFGLIRVQAHGIRKVTSKLRQSIQDHSLSKIALVYGKTGWRMTNAKILEDYYHKFDQRTIKVISKIFSLLERMIPNEEKNSKIFEIVTELHKFIEKSQKKDKITEKKFNLLEIAALLKILHELGYVGEEKSIQTIINLDFDEFIKKIKGKDKEMIKIINIGIKESHL